MEKYLYKELTEKIIGAGHTVHGSLGYGFLEKVYHNALLIELEELGLEVESQKKMCVSYRGKLVGEFYADIVVNDKVVVEVKAVNKHQAIFEAQLLNYLKATEMKVGLIINFGPSVQVKRMARSKSV